MKIKTNAKSKKEEQEAFILEIVDFNEGKKGIQKILETHYAALNGYSNMYLLWDAAQNQLSMFLNDNGIDNEEKLWTFVTKVFFMYIFDKPHIWKTNPNYPKTIQGLMINQARIHGGIITREQVNEYYARIKLKISSFQVTMLRSITSEVFLYYENDKFILSENLDLSKERYTLITKALDNLFRNENASFLILRDINPNWFSCLPPLRNNIMWTPLLFQEVLRVNPNIGYSIITPTLKRERYSELGAGIVPVNSSIQTFADLVYQYCREIYTLPIKMQSEELREELCKSRIIENRQLKKKLHDVLKDYRFSFTSGNKEVKILEI